MYHVTVYRDGEAIDQRDFEIGTWKEIGYWLDYYAYIETECRIEITISA